MGISSDSLFNSFSLKEQEWKEVKEYPLSLLQCCGNSQDLPRNQPYNYQTLYSCESEDKAGNGVWGDGQMAVQSTWWSRVDQAAFVKGSPRSKSVIWVGAGDRTGTKCPVSFPSANPTLANVHTWPNLMAQGHTASRWGSWNWNTGCDFKALHPLLHQSAV